MNKKKIVIACILFLSAIIALVLGCVLGEKLNVLSILTATYVMFIVPCFIICLFNGIFDN